MLPDSVGVMICQFLFKNYQCLYAVHCDSENVHLHFAFNPVSYVDGTRYRGTRAQFYKLRNEVQSILRYFGINRLYYYL